MLNTCRRVAPFSLSCTTPARCVARPAASLRHVIEVAFDGEVARFIVNFSIQDWRFKGAVTAIHCSYTVYFGPALSAGATARRSVGLARTLCSAF